MSGFSCTLLSTIVSGPDIGISLHAARQQSAEAVECDIKFSQWNPPSAIQRLVKILWPLDFQLLTFSFVSLSLCLTRINTERQIVLSTTHHWCASRHRLWVKTDCITSNIVNDTQWLKMICNDFLVVKVNCWSCVFNIIKSVRILRNIKK